MSSTEANEFLQKDYCPELLKTSLADLPDISSRNSEVSELTESFFLLYGTNPNSRVLQQLTDYLLLDHIKDPSQTKKDTVPIMTDRQLKTRRKKESTLTSDVMDHLHAKKQFNFAIKKNTQEKELE